MTLVTLLHDDDAVVDAVVGGLSSLGQKQQHFTTPYVCMSTSTNVWCLVSGVFVCAPGYSG